MPIIDAQVHLNHIGLGGCLAAMDAVGIDAAIIDLWPPQGERLANGALRCRYDAAEDAVRQFPARFAYVARLDPADPDLTALMAGLRARPGCLGVRVDQPPPAQFATGGYTPFFRLAADHGIPVWVVLPGRLPELVPYARQFPGLTFVVDHAGMPETWNRTDPARFAPLDALLALAPLPNVAVKWGHMTKLSAEPFPYPDVLRHLRRVVDAFGAERVLWESDWTQCLGHETLAEMLLSIQSAEAFSANEKAWLLGRAALAAMRWERAEDRVDVIAVADADWEAFARDLSRQRLPNGRVRLLRFASGGAPQPATGERWLSTAPLPGTRHATVAEAVAAAVSGRLV